MNMRPIWVTGAGGLIGAQVWRLAGELWPGQPVRGLIRADLDLTDARSLQALFNADPPAGVIHCAAISKAAACETNRELAWQINVEATRELARLAEDIPFILFSTDLVFDGRRGGYTEDDPPNPLNFYGETKVQAERVVLANPRHTVIRTSLNFGFSETHDRAFNEELVAQWERGGTVNLFSDEFRCPIAAEVTARVAWHLLKARLNGLYHVAGGQRLSRVELGRICAELRAPLPSPLRVGSLRDYRGPARAADVSLCVRKIEKALGLKMPGFGDWAGENRQRLVPLLQARHLAK